MTSSKVICSLRLDPRLRRFLDVIADQRQLSFNSLVAMTLAEYWHFDPRRAARTREENGDEPSARVVAPAEEAARPSRNAPCPCGSGLKYKRCCGARPV
jgi:uncharacterized protein YecA (UPF0149 family)